MLRTQPASVRVEAPPPAVPEPVLEEFEFKLEPELEPEPERKPALPSDVRQAILAALEHGSHTISELVMVTAMSTPEIRTNLSQLARQRKVTRVKREGDGKSAFALPASSAPA
jgi:predicted Rossmann fold nucleotide-binding protein DprA/Smf involved in DNA uptake